MDVLNIIAIEQIYLLYFKCMTIFFPPCMFNRLHCKISIEGNFLFKITTICSKEDVFNKYELNIFKYMYVVPEFVKDYKDKVCLILENNSNLDGIDVYQERKIDSLLGNLGIEIFELIRSKLTEILRKDGVIEPRKNQRIYSRKRSRDEHNDKDSPNKR